MYADEHAADTPGTDGEDEPSLRQKLHWATGDRDAEAKAVADRAPEEVTEEDAKIAVNRAHGDSPEDVATDGPLATTDDAERAAEDRSD